MLYSATHFPFFLTDVGVRNRKSRAPHFFKAPDGVLQEAAFVFYFFPPFLSSLLPNLDGRDGTPHLFFFPRFLDEAIIQPLAKRRNCFLFPFFPLCPNMLKRMKAPAFSPSLPGEFILIQEGWGRRTQRFLLPFFPFFLKRHCKCATSFFFLPSQNAGGTGRRVAFPRKSARTRFSSPLP